jgi:hypothetical protein
MALNGNLRYMRELASKKKAKERKFKDKARKWAITGTAALGLLGVGLTKDMDFGYKPFENFEKKDSYEITLQGYEVDLGVYERK